VFAAALAKAGNDQFRVELFPNPDHRIASIKQATSREPATCCLLQETGRHSEGWNNRRHH